MSTLHEQALRDRVRQARQAQQAALDAEDAEAFDLASEEMAEAKRLAFEHGISLADLDLSEQEPEAVANGGEHNQD